MKEVKEEKEVEEEKEERGRKVRRRKYRHTNVLCPLCNRHGLQRIERKGFLQNTILPMFGYFPWSCYFCRVRSIIRRRSADQPDPNSSDRDRES